MPTDQWSASGWGYRVTGTDELTRAIGRIGTLKKGRRYVWRGVVSARCSLSSALWRDMAPDGADVPWPNEAALRQREENIIREARSWGLGYGPGGFVDDLHLLAQLQHHGVPTRLIDVTSNPMTALWFACETSVDPQSKSGVLFAIDVTGFVDYASISEPSADWGAHDHGLSWTLSRALSESAKRSAPFVVRPLDPDRRMQAQEGLFISGSVPDHAQHQGVRGLPIALANPPGREKLENIFAAEPRSAGRPGPLPFCALVIPPEVKAKMRPHLEATYNRRRSLLFPDIAGYRDAIADGAIDLGSWPAP